MTPPVVTCLSMKKYGCLILLLTVSLSVAWAQSNPSMAIRQAKPWTYWWWMGNAVNEADITQQLEQFAKAGLGGVHITPIYGVKGYENQFIPYLSDRWLAVFAHTVREADRLGMGVDLTTGTGWPFGGPGVGPSIAAKQWKVDQGKLIPALTGQQVKRPAPGGQGPVLDYFSQSAVRQYLQRFDSTLARLPEKPRAVYNDSYEVYGANWTSDFLTEFKKRRGYDLTDQLPAFLDTTAAETTVLVHQDYHQTLSELLLEGFAGPWSAWAHQYGYKTRNQAHGSPGNLIDLYAQADIPETESFGSSRFPIPGLRVDANYEVDRFGTPSPLAMKLASSAAHLTGKPLVSSETGTWLANHFQVSLAQIKPQVDELFTAGINHIFYHGIPYSPSAERWPGWLFYASTNYGPTSHFWPHLPHLNRYIERCQTRLQASRPDNDVLLYFPIHDLWATRAKSAGGIHQLEVHHVERWLLPQPVGQLGQQLLQRGYSFDYVSDAFLTSLSVTKGVIHAGSSTYKVIVIPHTTYLPEASLRQLERLARQGARLLIDGAMPQQAPGFYNHQVRSAEVRARGNVLARLPSVTVAADPFRALARLHIRVESWATQGLSFIRKRSSAGLTSYFIANLDNHFHQDWIALSAEGNITGYDPLTDRTDQLPVRKDRSGQPKVLLQLEPGQSYFLTVKPGAPATPRAIGKNAPANESVAISTPWYLQFGSGRPAITASKTIEALTSWTNLTDSAGYFSGGVRYTTVFDMPADQPARRAYRLDLGDVREVADVRLNGQSVGTAWCLPFQLTIPVGLLKPRGNRLEIDVTNLSANYMRLYDRQYPAWKKFYDINMVDIRYQPFDATRWQALPSGLLGPVRLTPVGDWSRQ